MFRVMCINNIPKVKKKHLLDAAAANAEELMQPP
jgi:hypothetical protein